MSLFSPLSLQDRTSIELLLKNSSNSLSAIARLISRSKNAVVLDVRRNGGRESYTAITAQENAEIRRDTKNQKLSMRNKGHIGNSPRSLIIQRLKNLEMQVQILSETIRELLNAKNK